LAALKEKKPTTLAAKLRVLRSMIEKPVTIIAIQLKQ